MATTRTAMTPTVRLPPCPAVDYNTAVDSTQRCMHPTPPPPPCPTHKPCLTCSCSTQAFINANCVLQPLCSPANVCVSKQTVVFLFCC
jgi:hypothetical protein